MLRRFFSPCRLSYVETHYRFRYGFSLLSRPAPEMLFDAPSRIDQAESVPVVMIIKDADRFPVTIRSITVAVSFSEQSRTFLHNLQPDEHEIRAPLWHRVFTLPLPGHFTGLLHLNFKVDYVVRGKTSFFMNDNLPFGSHIGYSVMVSRTSLPAPPGYVSGDMHVHSSYTNDEVEFGSPLPALVRLGRAQGLSFACVMDHSYDLDERNPFNAGANAFSTMRKEAAALTSPEFVLLPGEEVSALTKRKKTVHAGIVNSETFFPGYRDSGRKLSGKTEDTTIETLAKAAAASPHTLVFAAHPRPGWMALEKLLLNRGDWEPDDFNNAIGIVQFWNGRMDAAFFKGKKAWLALLASGKKIVIVGGNDAHGDFNRTRRIGFPFLWIKEDCKNRFGFVRTVVACDRLSAGNLIEAIRAGKTMVSNGPFVSIEACAGTKRACMGETISGADISISIQALSTDEFGPLCSLSLFQGSTGSSETLVFSCALNAFSEKAVHSVLCGKPGWIRAEVSSRLGKDVFLGMTNPIWIHP